MATPGYASGAVLDVPPAAVPTKAVYGAIAAVMAELCKEGIGKTSVNESQKYRFRGIDAVYNALSPIMSKAGLVVLPRIVSRDVVERLSTKGTPLFYVTVEAEFDFVAVSDGSSHVIRTYGEAMDSGDKATNKAMSAAYKYAAFQAFCIPTEGDNDADATTHEVIATPQRLGRASSTDRPNGYAEWKIDMEATADEGAASLQKAWKATAPAIQRYAEANDAAWLDALEAKSVVL